MKRKLGEMEFASAEAAASQMASSSTRRESQLEHSSTSHHSLSPSPADDAEAENRIACAHCPSTFSDVQEWFEHCKVHPWSVQFMDLPSNESPSAAPSASPNTTVTATQQPTKVSKPSRRIQKRQKWESIKEEVHHLYFVKGMTLQATMTEIESKYSFKAR
ncbi:uncharacterized protein LY89DRAFT_679042 [Mollisia scopiformis]|uniref:C2H2-type domain-containing protein n=1 Tax=Mollisia scopiformis TaxID=149040 RepID=A0A194XTQ9_MOLSC|nr:uncharacterized protein LY89DRAFT_679042 [Mollisia scopiformis]KUJ23705.1 hypothetical protein LY89DRAFT_679042 [Mollisia scopiformis]